MLNHTTVLKLRQLVAVMDDLQQNGSIIFSQWREAVLGSPLLKSAFDFVPITSFYFSASKAASKAKPATSTNTSTAAISETDLSRSPATSILRSLSARSSSHSRTSSPQSTSRSTSGAYAVHVDIDKHVDIEGILHRAAAADGMDEGQKVGMMRVLIGKSGNSNAHQRQHYHRYAGGAGLHHTPLKGVPSVAEAAHEV